MKITPLTTITLDDAVYDISKLPENIQTLVSYFEDWRQQEANLTSDLLMVRQAISAMQQEIATTIRKERDDLRAKTAAFGAEPPHTDQQST